MPRNSWRDYDDRGAAPQVVFDVTSTNGMMLICNIIMAIIIIIAMLRDQYSTTTAVISAAVYFLGATFFIAVVMSGSLTNIIVNGQRERTERRKWEVLEAQGRNIPQLPPTPNEPSTGIVQTSNYVAPAEDGIRREAYAWLLALFDADGYLDQRKIIMQPTDSTPAGRVRVKMPSRPAVEYLLLRKVLREFTDGNGHKNGYGLRISTLPHREALAELNI